MLKAVFTISGEDYAKGNAPRCLEDQDEFSEPPVRDLDGTGTLSYPEGDSMCDFIFLRKFVTLKDGTRLLIRPLNSLDGDYLCRLFEGSGRAQGTESPEDLVAHLDYRTVLPIVAVELKEHRFSAYAALRSGKYPMPLVGEINLLVSYDINELELGSILLKELIRLGEEREFHLLKAVVPTEQERLSMAFEDAGFECCANLENVTEKRKAGQRSHVMMKHLAQTETSGADGLGSVNPN